MKKIIFIFCFSFLVANYLSGETLEQKSIKWMSIEEAIALNKTNPKKIFIDVYTDWCGWCKSMDRITFSHPYIIDYMNEHYYAVKFDAEQSKEIEFNGKLYTNQPIVAGQNRKPTHTLTYELLNGKASYPSFVVLHESLNKLFIQAGFISVLDLDPVLKYYSFNTWESISYEDFKNHFKSPLKDFYDEHLKLGKQNFDSLKYNIAQEHLQICYGMNPLNQELKEKMNFLENYFKPKQ